MMTFRGLLVGLSALAFAVLPAAAQQLPMNVRISGQYTPLGYCQLTSLNAAVGLSSCPGGIPAGAVVVQLCSESVALRYRDDGSLPTATVGMPINSGTCFQYAGYPLSAFSVIQGAASGVLDVAFYK